MATEGDFYIRDNADYSEPLTWDDEFNNPIDFTGSTFRMDIKSSVDDASAIVSLTTTNGGIESTDLANGKITVKFADFSIPPGAYVYDLLRLNGSERPTLLYGKLIVDKGVTGL